MGPGDRDLAPLAGALGLVVCFIGIAIFYLYFTGSIVLEYYSSMELPSN